MALNKIFIIDDDILEVDVVGDQTGASVTAMGKEVRDCLAQLRAQHKPGLILDDISQMGHTDIPARQIVTRLARSLPYKKVAMFGGSSVLMRYGTRLLLQAIGMGSRIKYFEKRDDAIRWLKA